ncbi:MAG: GTP 3',8-cyclase MoaA [Oscillospiraceae bacterium]|jgi:cyclic pyranopterin phosphate synthase|nr:GTP 3',8-cyclase MoaA [Oscillospiraceae bacterium]
MKDSFGRNITYLRLSVTDKCNLRCRYCMPPEGVTTLRHQDILSVEEISDIVRAAAEIGITKVRVTGGEPLVRKGIVEICRRIAAVPGITELCLTTNGTLLDKFAAELSSAGVQRINISLDALDPAIYARITCGGDVTDVLRGIAAAEAAFNATQLNAVKLNCVPQRGINEGEIPKLRAFADRNGFAFRLIELMPIGKTADYARAHYLPVEEGIAVLSHPFCTACNRLRVTCDGKVKPCLHSSQEFPLRGKDYKEVLREALLAKPKGHNLSAADSLSARNMNAIGG